MYHGLRQRGFIPVLQSFGSSPLELWGMKVQNGSVRRVTDEQVRALALELAGTNVSTVYVCCPKNPKQSLGIYMPYLVMIIKSLKKYFTFEVTILDDRNVHRRFRMSNFQKANQIHHFCTSMPLCLNPGWNEIYFDLADLTRKAYKTNYVETTRIQIHANCRIRVIYFCDRIYQDKDIPQKFKIFLPNNHVCRKKSTEKAVEEKETELIASSDLEAEYRSFEDEEREEASYSDEGLTHSGVIEQVFEQRTMLASGEGEEYESAPITPIEEEEEEEEKEEKEGEEAEEADAEHEELVVVKTEVEMKTEPQEVEVNEESQEVEVKQELEELEAKEELEELEAKEEPEEAGEDEQTENDVVEG